MPQLKGGLVSLETETETKPETAEPKDLIGKNCHIYCIDGKSCEGTLVAVGEQWIKIRDGSNAYLIQISKIVGILH